MRIRLRIDRPGDLPTVKLLWPTEGLRTSAAGRASTNPAIASDTSAATGALSSGSSLRIVDLLRQVDEVIPLRLGDCWGLEDYVVEIGGFECLHFARLDSVLLQDEVVTIRFKSLEDVRTRRIAGRDQISAAGMRLYDGVPWDRPFLRAAQRPAIEPPKKLIRLSPELDAELDAGLDGSVGQLVRFESPIRRLEDSAGSTPAHPLRSGGSTLQSRPITTPTMIRRTDGRKVVKPAQRSSAARPVKTVRFAEDVTELQVASDEESEDDADFELDDAISSASEVESSGDETSTNGSSSGSASSDSSSDADSDSSSEDSAESSSQTSSVSVEPVFEARGQPAPSPRKKVEAISRAMGIDSAASGVTPVSESTQKSRPPGEGLTRTKKRNERRAWTVKLRKLKETGLLPQDAGILEAKAVLASMKPGDVGPIITGNLEQRKKTLLEGLASGGIDVGSNEALMKDQPSDMNASEADLTTPDHSMSKSAANTPVVPVLDESWKDKITLTAVECYYDRSRMPNPPFPFVQRWHQQKKSNKGQKRKFDEQLGDQPQEENPVLQSGSEHHGPPLRERPRGSGYQQLTSEAGELPQSEIEDAQDLPQLPDDLSSLKPLNSGSAVTGAIIAFREMEMSEATSWNPRISEHKTAEIIDLAEDGTMELRLALRDRPSQHKQYDPHTGQRIYSRFEAPDLSDSEDDDTAAFRTCKVAELIEPLVVTHAEPHLLESELRLASSSPREDEFQTPLQDFSAARVGQPKPRKASSFSPSISTHRSEPAKGTTVNDEPTAFGNAISNEIVAVQSGAEPHDRSYLEHGLDGSSDDTPRAVSIYETPASVPQYQAAPMIATATVAVEEQPFTPIKQDLNDDDLYDATPAPSIQLQLEVAAAARSSGDEDSMINFQANGHLAANEHLGAASPEVAVVGEGPSKFLVDSQSPLPEDSPLLPLEDTPEPSPQNNATFDADLTDDSFGLPSISFLLSQPVKPQPIVVDDRPPPSTAPARNGAGQDHKKGTAKGSTRPKAKKNAAAARKASPAASSDAGNRPLRQNPRTRLSEARAEVDLTLLSDGHSSEDSEIEYGESGMRNGLGWVQKR